MAQRDQAFRRTPQDGDSGLDQAVERCWNVSSPLSVSRIIVSYKTLPACDRQGRCTNSSLWSGYFLFLFRLIFRSWLPVSSPSLNSAPGFLVELHGDPLPNELVLQDLLGDQVLVYFYRARPEPRADAGTYPRHELLRGLLEVIVISSCDIRLISAIWISMMLVMCARGCGTRSCHRPVQEFRVEHPLPRRLRSWTVAL